MAKARRRRPSRRPPEPGGIGRDHWRADGQEKARFRTEDEANRSAMQRRLESGADLNPYCCDWCGGWHLGNRGDDPGRAPVNGPGR
jgi:hypothetical protein